DYYCSTWDSCLSGLF
nr:immunoglobulin light chain junction region [Macaca mulatta]MOW57597.1 immunoglobulin light chain junction region [Macaca mulatta]MOW58896.1 immunoglobulin light chain junction region [Macaca mulatta]MOW60216.1 immunoglobulin light chain junction region [Macaca mulatta]MOW61352.1 immunoglobulin light chain junction region [Macaca mulatta]